MAVALRATQTCLNAYSFCNDGPASLCKSTSDSVCDDGGTLRCHWRGRWWRLGRRLLHCHLDRRFDRLGRTATGLLVVAVEGGHFGIRLSFESLVGIASFCVTENHWSDNVTSRVYVKDVAVPYFKAKIAELRTVDPSLCKEFGSQICVLIIDCWWGWLDAAFREWLAAEYPWIRLLFVPAACTPVAQPMDAGIIAKIKAILRRSYGRWVVALTQEQIKGVRRPPIEPRPSAPNQPPLSSHLSHPTAGVKPEDIKIPADVPTCKKNLFLWLSESVAQLNKDKPAIAHCWESTQLLRAWERDVQAEAARKVAELFPNYQAAGLAVDLTNTEDPEAGLAGAPFTEPEHEEEWEGLVDWAAVAAQTGGAGPSSV